MRLRDLWDTLLSLWALIPALSAIPILVFGAGSLKANFDREKKKKAPANKKPPESQAKSTLGFAQVGILVIGVILLCLPVLFLATAVRLMFSRELVLSTILVMGILLNLAGIALAGVQLSRLELSAKRLVAIGGGAVLCTLGCLCLFTANRSSTISLRLSEGKLGMQLVESIIINRTSNDS